MIDMIRKFNIENEVILMMCRIVKKGRWKKNQCLIFENDEMIDWGYLREKIFPPRIHMKS